MTDGIYALPGATFAALLDGATAGLVGTIGVKLLAIDGSTVVARTTDGIIDLGDGVYRFSGTAPATEGQYIIRWDTGGVDPEYASESLFVNEYGAPAPGLDSITPALEEVGSILRARTRSDETGAESGTFSAGTRPTSTEVLELMEQAKAEVIVHCPADLTTLPERLRALARRMVALRTAMFIELSLYPDQTVESDSVYDKLDRDYDRLTKTFLAALADGDGANVGRSVMRSISMVSPYFEESVDDEG